MTAPTAVVAVLVVAAVYMLLGARAALLAGVCILLFGLTTVGNVLLELWSALLDRLALLL